MNWNRIICRGAERAQPLTTYERATKKNAVKSSGKIWIALSLFLSYFDLYLKLEAGKKDNKMRELFE